jgi:hypothetical protein
MGRGLSHVQKRILIYVRDDGLAARKGFAVWLTCLRGHAGDRLRRQLLPGRTIYRDNSLGEGPGHLCDPGGCVILSRSLKSLERRGLIWCIRNRTKHVHAIELTPAGRAVAEALGTYAQVNPWSDA